MGGGQRALGWAFVVFFHVENVWVEGVLRNIIHIPEGSIPGPLVLAPGLKPAYYLSQSVDEFLKISPMGCRGNISLCSAVMMVPGTMECTPDDVKYVEDLKVAQDFIREYRSKLTEANLQSYITSGLMILNVILGAFLIARKHLNWRTLFSSAVPDPTYGMPLWQYRMMQFTVATVDDTRLPNVKLEELEKQSEYYRQEKAILHKFQMKLGKSKINKSSAKK